MYRFLLGLYALLFAVILWLAYTGHLPPQLEAIPGYDLAGHVILYGAASYIGHRALGGRTWRWGGRRIPWFPAGFAIATLAEEAVQSIAPNRTFSLLDALCSLLGIGLGWWLAERDRTRIAASVQARPLRDRDP